MTEENNIDNDVKEQSDNAMAQEIETESTGSILRRLQNSELEKNNTSNENNINSLDNEPKPEDKEKTNNKKEDNNASEEKLKNSDLEKFENEAKKAKSWANDLSRKLKNYERKIKNAIEEGVLDEEEGQEFLKEIVHESPKEETYTDNPFSRHIKIFDAEIENIIKYGQEKDVEQKIRSFNLLLQEGTLEELQEVYEQLEELAADPIAMTKKVLEIGKEHYENTYNEFYEAGSIKNLKKKYIEQINNYKKTIEKLEKQIVKYKEEHEGYVPASSYKRPAGSALKDAEESEKFESTGEILRRRQQF